MQQKFDAIVFADDPEIVKPHVAEQDEAVRAVIPQSLPFYPDAGHHSAAAAEVDATDIWGATPLSPVVCSFEEQFGRAPEVYHL